MLSPKQLGQKNVRDKEEDRKGWGNVVQASDVDHDVVGGKVVEDVAEGQIAKRQEAGERHDDAAKARHARGDVRDFGKPVHCRFAEGSVD